MVCNPFLGWLFTYAANLSVLIPQCVSDPAPARSIENTDLLAGVVGTRLSSGGIYVIAIHLCQFLMPSLGYHQACILKIPVLHLVAAGFIHSHIQIIRLIVTVIAQTPLAVPVLQGSRLRMAKSHGHQVRAAALPSHEYLVIRLYLPKSSLYLCPMAMPYTALQKRVIRPCPGGRKFGPDEQIHPYMIQLSLIILHFRAVLMAFTF